MISGCYSPVNPLKWTQGSRMSWNRSPRCQKTLNIPPVCDPRSDLLKVPDANAAPPVLLEEEGGKRTATMMDTKLDQTWWDTPQAHKTHTALAVGGKSPVFNTLSLRWRFRSKPSPGQTWSFFNKKIFGSAVWVLSSTHSIKSRTFFFLFFLPNAFFCTRKEMHRHWHTKTDWQTRAHDVLQASEQEHFLMATLWVQC